MCSSFVSSPMLNPARQRSVPGSPLTRAASAQSIAAGQVVLMLSFEHEGSNAQANKISDYIRHP